MSALINGTVKFPSKEVDTRFGRRINVVIVTQEGQEITQWANPDDPELKALKKNQKVTLIKDKNNKYSILYNDHLDSEPVKGETLDNTVTWTNDLKKQICLEASQLIDFYDYCNKQVRTRIKDFNDEESIRSIATTIFIQIVRKV